VYDGDGSHTGADARVETALFEYGMMMMKEKNSKTRRKTKQNKKLERGKKEKN